MHAWKKIDFPSSSSHQLLIFHHLGVRLQEPLPHPYWNFWLPWCCMDFWYAVTVTVSSQVQWPCCTETCFIAVIHYFHLVQFGSSFMTIPKPWEKRRLWDRCTIWVWALQRFYSLHVGPLWISILIITYNKKFLLWGLKDASKGNKDKKLGGSLVLCPFSRII